LYVLSNLDPGYSYYISLAAVDTSGNISAMSPEINAAPLGTEGNEKVVLSKNVLRTESDCIKIDYNYPDKAAVNIDVATITGKIIKTFAPVTVTVGSTFWCGDNDRGKAVINGFYFIRIKAVDEITIQKVMIQK
ncbi:MAG TPA: hypothetical protein VKS21_05445, partial [Spirochaetota bacterium]|nr:hypothetical protein [Spirochaetota bacterium]